MTDGTIVVILLCLCIFFTLLHSRLHYSNIAPINKFAPHPAEKGNSYTFDEGVWEVVKETLMQDSDVWQAYNAARCGSYYYLEFRDEANAAMQRGGKDAVVAVTKREFKIK